MSIVRRLFDAAPLCISFLVLITSVLLFTYGVGISPFPPIHWLLVSYRTLTQLLAFCLLPAILLLLFIWTVFVQRDRSVFTAIAAILLSANFCMIFAAILPLNQAYRQRVETQMEEKNYYVVSHWDTSWNKSQRTYFDLFQCDTLGVSCEIIHTQFYEGMSLEEYDNVIARLLPNPATNTLSMEINGKVVYTHHPED